MRRLFILGVVALAGCQPVVKDIPAGGLIDPADIHIRVENEGGSNLVTLINETPGIAGQWDYMAGRATGDRVEVILPFIGQIPIKFYAFSAGGIVVATTTANVTQLDVPVDEMWGFFAGTSSSGKVWGWGDAGNNGGTVYGSGGYGHSKVPNWGGVAIGAVRQGHTVDGAGTMTFDLNGGSNITVTDGEGSRRGTFSFDRTKAKANYSVAQLTVYGATILTGYNYADGSAIPQVFDIVKLTDSEMVLNWAAPGAVIFDPAWATSSTMWMFVRR